MFPSHDLKGLKLPYTIRDADFNVPMDGFQQLITATIDPVTATLPSAVQNDSSVVNIKNYYASTKTVTLTVGGGETIDGLTSITVAADESLTLQAIGSLDMWTVW